MASDNVVPLGELNGPSLFPRTFRASTGRTIPADCRDLDSIHNFMKSLELPSPERLMNEAKRIVDGGMEHLESSLAEVAEKVGLFDAVAAKGKDRAQERRPGLGRARKKGSFSLKPSVSQPTVTLEPSLNIDQLQDPDEFFDAYERLENAKKEIQKQLGGSVDNLNQYNPSINARHRRPGILGKSYNIKHRYSLAPSENDDMLMSSQETVEQNIPSAHKDESQVKLMEVDSTPQVDLEKVELAVPMKKTENKVSEILEELLSCDAEDLDGDGALNLLKERFKIKPLDFDNQSMAQLHGVRGTNNLSAGDRLLKSRKSSLIIDSVLKDINSKSRVEHNQVPQNSVDAVSSPTPPRSPFASLSLLRKKILQSTPLRDPFSPLDVDLSASNSASPVQPIDKLQEQADVPANLSMSSELNYRADVESKEPNTNTRKVGSPRDQFVVGSIQGANVDIRPSEVPIYNAEQTVNVENLNDFKSSSSIIVDPQKVVGFEGSFSDQFVDDNAGIQRANADDRPSEVLDYNSVEMMNTENFNGTQNSSSIIPDEQEVVGSNNYFADKFADENAGKQRANADDRPNELPSYNTEERMNLENVNANDATEDLSSRQLDAEQQPQVSQAIPKTGKRDQVGEKRIRKAHPMRKSIAESGTSFETGVRRSKRIRMRPLEYWKGERFVYGRTEESRKLLGVKYISPGKGSGDLKVKPYISSELSRYKELLELAARH